MAAPTIVQTCWRGQRTPMAGECQVLHHECLEPTRPARYGDDLANAWRWRDDDAAPGLWVVEHDMAVDPGDRRRMLAQIEATPDQVIAAPYLCWPASTNLPEPFTLPDVFDGWPRFGLGCTYLPARLLNAVETELADWVYPEVDWRLSQAAHQLHVPVHTLRGAHVKHLHY